MAKVMVLTTVPNTAEMAKSSASLATTTVTATATATVTKTISSAARTSFYSTTKLSKSAVPSAVPDHLMTRVMDLMRVTGFNKSSLIAGAVQIGLGTVIIHGFKLAWSRLPVESVPPGEDPKRWKDKVRFAYNFLKNAAGENERLRRDIERARQEAQVARQEQQAATMQFNDFEDNADRLRKELGEMEQSEQLYKAEIVQTKDQLRKQEQEVQAEAADVAQLRLEIARLEAEKRDQVSQSEKAELALRQQVDQLGAEKAMLATQLQDDAESNKKLLEQKDTELQNVAESNKDLLEQKDAALQKALSERAILAKDLEDAHHDIAGFRSDLRFNGEIIQLLEETDASHEALINELTVSRAREKEDRIMAESELALLKPLLARSSPVPAGADNVSGDNAAPPPSRSTEPEVGLDASPPPVPSSPQEASQAPDAADSSAALSEASDKGTPSRKRRRSPKASKTDAMPNKRRAPSPKETYGDMASESESMDLDAVMPAPDKALDLTNVPRLARPDEASSMALRAPAPAPPATPAAAPVTAPPATARRSSRLPVAAPTPGRELRNRTAVNYAEGSRRSTQPQTVPETPAARRRGAASATPAPETARRMTRSQSPTKRLTARR